MKSAHALCRAAASIVMLFNRGTAAVSVILFTLSCVAAYGQSAPAPPPSVGVFAAVSRPVTETNEFIGRIEATNRVSIVARVTAFLDSQQYREGAEVKAGESLYALERGPFEADLAAKQAMVEQLQATLENAKLTTERARTLLGGPAGQQSIYDAAIASQRSLEAQVKAAQAEVRQSQINLDYTDIKSPIDGKIGKTAVTIGNVVNPGSGVLTTVVSQDPMYVTFPVPVRQLIALRGRYSKQGGFEAVTIKVRLPDGRMYGQAGQLNFVNNGVAQTTDTILLRGTIPNPPLIGFSGVVGTARELTDGEFISVFLESVHPEQWPAIPRSAVLADNQGDYVYLVGPDDKAEQRRITLGQSTKTVASVTGGLKVGEKVIVEGLQRVKSGQAVSPGAASALVLAEMDAPQGPMPFSAGLPAGSPLRTGAQP